MTDRPAARPGARRDAGGAGGGDRPGPPGIGTPGGVCSRPSAGRWWRWPWSRRASPRSPRASRTTTTTRSSTPWSSSCSSGRASPGMAGPVRTVAARSASIRRPALRVRGLRSWRSSRWSPGPDRWPAMGAGSPWTTWRPRASTPVHPAQRARPTPRPRAAPAVQSRRTPCDSRWSDTGWFRRPAADDTPPPAAATVVVCDPAVRRGDWRGVRRAARGRLAGAGRARPAAGGPVHGRPAPGDLRLCAGQLTRAADRAARRNRERRPCRPAFAVPAARTWERRVVPWKSAPGTARGRTGGGLAGGRGTP